MRCRTTLRPAYGGGLPAGVQWRYVEAPSDLFWPGSNPPPMPRSKHLYGVIETDRDLTPEEMKHFDIVLA